MKKKNVIVILLSIVVFLSATVVGFTTVFRIDGVELLAHTVSDEAQTEATELSQKLTELYEGDNILFATDDSAKELFEEYPYFRLTGFKKVYPNKLVVDCTEDVEMYAVQKGEDYYILSVEGTILGIRDNPSNRSGGPDNVLITGLSIEGEKGDVATGDVAWESVVKAGQTASQILGGIRGNVVSISVAKPTSDPSETVIKFKTRETVNLYLRNPYDNVEEKTTALINKYLSLEDDERLSGMVLAESGVNGITATYFVNDLLGTYFQS